MPRELDKNTKEYVYNAAKMCYEKYGFCNSKTLIRYYGCTEYSLHKLGGGKTICEELGLTYRHDNIKPCTKDDIIEDFKRVHEEYGRIDSKLYQKYGKYSGTIIKRFFAGYNDLMKTCGYEENMTRMDSKELVSEDIWKIYNENKDVFSSSFYRKNGKYAQSVVDRIFGNWESAMVELGLPIVKKEYGHERIKSDVDALIDKYGFISKKIIDDNLEYSYPAVMYSFGGTKKFREIYGEKMLSDRYKSSCEIIVGNILEKHFGDKLEKEKTFDFLINPKTKRHMFFDFYIKDINTCVEYDGEQHFKFIKAVHRTEEGFNELVERDRLKDKLAKDNGMRVVRMNCYDKITEEFVISKVCNYE